MIIPDAPPFIQFMPSHLVVIIISLFLFIYIPYQINKHRKASWIETISKSLGILLIGNEMGWVIYKLILGHTNWAEFMPFELCTINAYVLGILLIYRPSYSIFEVIYFWAMGGTVQGIITPRLFAGFPHYLFFEYFITHTGIILAVLVLIFRYNWKVTWLSLWRYLLWLQVPALINLVFDFTFDVNYMFMRALPKVSSVLDYVEIGPGIFSVVKCLL
tara:strand:- start:15 stop:665 length:651 start_codon:yes stop_codon:yes gene_type:complete